MTDEWAKKIYQKLDAIDSKLFWVVMILIFVQINTCDTAHRLIK